MGAFLYPILTCFYVVMFFWGLRSFRESSFWGTSWLLFIMVALTYDNLILTIGVFIGVGETLEVLSLLRYLLNVFLTPTFVFIAWDILRRLRIEWSEYLTIRIVFNLYTFGVTVIGVYTEILWITLEPAYRNGVLQYIPSNHDHIPFALFLTIVPLFISGIFLWHKHRWPILIVGILFAIGIGAMAALMQNTLWVAIAECMLIMSLVLTECKLRHEDFQSTRSVQ